MKPLGPIASKLHSTKIAYQKAKFALIYGHWTAAQPQNLRRESDSLLYL